MKTDLINRTLTFASDLQVREAGEGQQSRIIEGYAILFNVESAPLYQDEDCEIREVISPSAITREVLDASDIKMTMFHDRQLILARSKNGQGTLSYVVDEKGVKFSFEAPNTIDGDKALELVKRGDLSGCSFAFSTYYYDEEYVSRARVTRGDYTITTYTVNKVTGVYDFTIAADPAYPDTTVDTRELGAQLKKEGEEKTVEKPVENNYREQASAMRKAARMFNL